MCSLGAHECGGCEIDDAALIGKDETSSTANGTTNDMARTLIADERICKKCQQEAWRTSRNGNSYCKTCFLVMTTHKFRAALGKSKTIRRGDCVLLAHSGRANSTVLLHLLKTGMSDSIAKKVPFRCSVLYIDDGKLKGRTLEEREAIARAIHQEFKDYEMAGYTVCLNENGNISSELLTMEESPRRSTIEDDSAVQKLFNGLENDTARDELLRQLRRKLLVSAARKLGCAKVLLADTSVDLAARVLGDISTGRGTRLSYDVGFSDARCSDVTLLRPLGDFTADEVMGYLNCYNLSPILEPLKYPRTFPGSIRGATRDFVHRLDSEFHSTVSTIYRTSGKLSSKSKETIESDDKCIVCEIALENELSSQEELSAVQARTFSEFASIGENLLLEQQSNDAVCQKHLEKEERCGCNVKTESLPLKTIERYLCYGCKYIFSSSKDTPNVVPAFVQNAARERLQLECMRKEISEFLL